MLNKREQKSLCKTLCTSMSNEFAKHVRDGRVPANWDGHEIREWLADKFEFERTRLMKSDRKRKSNYRNDVYENNL
jgi:hypothetical protein